MVESPFIHVNLAKTASKPRVQLSGATGYHSFTLRQFGEYVRDNYQLFLAHTFYSSSCDFPEEYGFPTDLDVREFVERQVCERVDAIHVRLQVDVEEDGTAVGKVVVYRSYKLPEEHYTPTELQAAITKNPERFLEQSVVFNGSCKMPQVFHLPDSFDVQELFESARQQREKSGENRTAEVEALLVAAFKAWMSLNAIRNQTVCKSPKVMSYDVAAELGRALAAACGCQVCDLPHLEKYNSWEN